VDGWQGDVARDTRTLSGGEAFLVSLALALALSDLVSSKTSIDSLFLDEGFGTLDGDTLEMALAALDALNASGKMIGVISHVEALKERSGADPRGKSGRNRLLQTGDLKPGSGAGRRWRHHARARRPPPRLWPTWAAWRHGALDLAELVGTVAAHHHGLRCQHHPAQVLHIEDIRRLVRLLPDHVVHIQAGIGLALVPVKRRLRKDRC
jgi:hypothetical protein